MISELLDMIASPDEGGFQIARIKEVPVARCERMCRSLHPQPSDPGQHGRARTCGFIF